jgi:ABC-type nickel/cobalt efflux system permease component RcnA
VGGSRACRRTRRGRATTTHTAPDTTVDHRNEGRLGDALACRAGRACDEKVVSRTAWAHSDFFGLSTGGAGTTQVRRHGVYGIPLVRARSLRGNVQKIQVASTLAAAPGRCACMRRDWHTPRYCLRHSTDVTRVTSSLHASIRPSPAAITVLVYASSMKCSHPSPGSHAQHFLL